MAEKPVFLPGGPGFQACEGLAGIRGEGVRCTGGEQAFENRWRGGWAE